MRSSESFKDYILDQLSEIPELWTRKMFGSFGIYSREIFFAIISDDVLYFKTNDRTKRKYIQNGSDYFRPSKKQGLKNYYKVPSEIVENMEELVEWAHEAIIF